MDLEREQEKKKTPHQGVNKFWWLTGQGCCVSGDEGAKVLASILLMHVPLTTLNLGCKTTTLLNMILKE